MLLSMFSACPVIDRRDKYDKSRREYWVDVSTVGKFVAAESEEIRDNTIAEGRADGFVLGGIESGPPNPQG